MSKSLWYTFLFSLIIYNSGCRLTKTTESQISEIDINKIKETARMKQIQIQSMKCEGTISIETQNSTQNGSFTLFLQKPDSILVNIEGPFGIKIGSALITRQNFLFYNSIENKLIVGSSSTENLSRIMHVELCFDDLMNLFVGGALPGDDYLKKEFLKSEDGKLIFWDHSSKFTRKYFIDPHNLTIRKIQSIDSVDRKIVEQTFSDFNQIGELTIPYTIRITRPQNRERLSLFYSNVIINSKQIRLTINYPETAEKLHWR